MAIEVMSGATQVSAALGVLTREVARSVVLVRGSRCSSGSGVIWDQPGLIITNHHVVPGASASVMLSTGRRVAARVLRRAPALDLAALRLEDVDVSELAARVGDSDALRVGDLL